MRASTILLAFGNIFPFILISNGFIQNCPVVEQTCGERRYPRIDGGEDAAIGEFPWAAHLPGCSGSIINRNWVMSARHCVSENDGVLEKDPDWYFSTVGIGVGTNNVNNDENNKNPGRRYKPLKIYINPDVDLALVKTEPMEMNDDANGACLPARNLPGQRGQRVWTSGFGWSEKGVGHLRKREVVVQSESSNGWSIQSGVLSGGDSGSPISQARRDGKFIQYGWVIHSRGGGKVQAYVDWIERTIRNNDPDICKVCPRGWTQYRNKCFKMADSRKNQADARSICQKDFAGDLIIIHSEEEQRFVQNFMKSRVPYDDWNFGLIGGHGSKQNGFSWNDRSAMDYVNWDHEQPDDIGLAHSPANCMAILLGNPGDPWTFGKWHDLECEYEHYFACQRVL